MYDLGPYKDHKTFDIFNSISDKAFRCFNNGFAKEQEKLDSAFHHHLVRFKYIAETTSASIRLINSWTFTIPALTLLRSRFEQLVVCSYLINEDVKIGLERYIKYGPINSYRQHQMACKDDQLRSSLSAMVDDKKIYDEAFANQKCLNEEFSENDRFQKKWTSLDLLSMVKRRDFLSMSSMLPYNRLEHDYLTIYVVLSSLVHADISSVNDSFLNCYIHKDKIVLMSSPFWMSLAMICCAKYDIMQCFEMSNCLGFSCSSEYIEIMKYWEEMKDKVVKESDG
ncbi:MAG: DUF5677 domain-containing protein [Halodesulfovibrio sp.]